MEFEIDPKEIEIEWRKEFAKVAQYPVDRELEREICITPFEGHYGTAGYVIAVNGSPPKGLMFVTTYADQRVNWMIVKAIHGKIKQVKEYSTHYKLWAATIELLETKVWKKSGGQVEEVEEAQK